MVVNYKGVRVNENTGEIVCDRLSEKSRVKISNQKCFLQGLEKFKKKTLRKGY